MIYAILYDLTATVAYMAVMATDQPSSTASNVVTTNGSRSPTEGGFTPNWNEEAEQRVEARRNRVQTAAAQNSRPTAQPTTEEIEDDDEERKNFVLNSDF